MHLGADWTAHIIRHRFTPDDPMYRSLQASRAMAALMVVAYHLGPAIEAYFGSPVLLAPWGRSGVEFFFVLSGFIITLAHFDDIGHTGRLGRFAYKRFVRIYPIYWIVFLVALAGASGLVRLTPAEFAHAMLLTPTGVAPVISVAWSLQWEIIFYLLFAALIAHPALAAMAVVGVLLWLPASWVYLLLFSAGMAAGLAERARARLAWRPMLIVGACLFALGNALDSQGSVFAFASGAAMMIIGLVEGERDGVVLGRGRAFQLLGDASYSIYLVHYPAISACCKLARWAGLDTPSFAPFIYVLVGTTAVGAGVLLHLCVEKPVLRRLGNLKLPIPNAVR